MSNQKQPDRLPESSFLIDLPEGWQTQMPETRLLTDEDKMQWVIRLAKWNCTERNGGPFAAAVFDRDSGELVSMGVNRVVPNRCSIAHAEAVAIGLAQKQTQSFTLNADGRRLELFASGQPCVQCFGMLWWSGMVRLVQAARSEDIEQLTEFSEGPLVNDWIKRLQNRSPLPAVKVTRDVCRAAACDVLRDYSRSGGMNYGP